MFEAFYELTDDSELDPDEYANAWASYRFTILKEIIENIELDNLSDKNRLRYYKLGETIFKELHKRLSEKNND